MAKYIMALDAGTTSNRCIIFDQQGSICSLAQKEFTQYFPRPGWVEHDPKEIFSTQTAVVSQALEKIGISPDDVCALGITNQRETTIVWDKNTGEPIYNALVWQDRRTAELTDRLQADGYKDMFFEKTGLVLDPYFSATKIRWILDNVKDGQARAEAGELCFGTVDSWLIWNLTGGAVHATDYSNASRTMLFNISDLCWDQEILDILNIPKQILPEVKPSSYIFGNASFANGEIPIAGVGGDQQCALFGQTCFEAGEAKNTYGTGAFVLMNTGSTKVRSQNGLITTIAWGLEEGKVSYALEGSVFVAGSSVQWLRDQLRIVDSAADSEYYATRVADTGGVYVVPAFTGLGAPYWDPYARGIIAGITRGTNRYHIVRATLESQAFLSNDVLSAMVEDLGQPLRVLNVDGGAVANNFLMQFQSDISGVEVRRPTILETTALGAAYFAGLATGYWKDLDEIKSYHHIDRVFKPEISSDECKRLKDNWAAAVSRSFSWAKDVKE